MDEKHNELFKEELPNLHPPYIGWEGQSWNENPFSGRDFKDSRRQNSHWREQQTPPLLSPTYELPSLVVWDLMKGIGLWHRLICMDDERLVESMKEYSKYLTQSGWDWKRAKTDLSKGERNCAKQINNKEQNKNHSDYHFFKWRILSKK